MALENEWQTELQALNFFPDIEEKKVIIIIIIIYIFFKVELREFAFYGFNIIY